MGQWAVHKWRLKQIILDALAPSVTTDASRYQIDRLMLEAQIFLNHELFRPARNALVRARRLCQQYDDISRLYDVIWIELHVVRRSVKKRLASEIGELQDQLDGAMAALLLRSQLTRLHDRAYILLREMGDSPGPEKLVQYHEYSIRPWCTVPMQQAIWTWSWISETPS